MPTHTHTHTQKNHAVGGPSPVAHRIQGFGSEPYYPQGGPQPPQYAPYDGVGGSGLSGSGGLSSSITVGVGRGGFVD